MILSPSKQRLPPFTGERHETNRHDRNGSTYGSSSSKPGRFRRWKKTQKIWYRYLKKRTPEIIPWESCFFLAAKDFLYHWVVWAWSIVLLRIVGQIWMELHDVQYIICVKASPEIPRDLNIFGRSHFCWLRKMSQRAKCMWRLHEALIAGTDDTLVLWSTADAKKTNIELMQLMLSRWCSSSLYLETYWSVQEAFVRRNPRYIQVRSPRWCFAPGALRVIRGFAKHALLWLSLAPLQWLLALVKNDSWKDSWFHSTFRGEDQSRIFKIGEFS